MSHPLHNILIIKAVELSMYLLNKLFFSYTFLRPLSQFMLGCSFLLQHALISPVYAQSYSYEQAEETLLTTSYLSQSQNLLQQSSLLEQQAIRNLGLPRVDLNARAYAFHSKVDVPLDQFKQKIEDQLKQKVNNQLNDFENIGVPPQALGAMQNTLNGMIQEGINSFPDYSRLSLEDQVIHPSISASMPIYTGGLTQSAKKVAEIQAKKSDLSYQQQQDAQTFSLIQHYFDVQLQHQLLQNHQYNLHAMQTHLNNAKKLEQQGFISKGQRMQFEVAYHNAERLLISNQNQLLASEHSLKSLLQSQTLNSLTTPLFIHLKLPDQLNPNTAPLEQATLLKQLEMDQALASEKINLHQAQQKPKVFAFGEYALDDKQNWIVGVMASYNLFSGIDSKKQVQAAQLQQEATQLLSKQTEQELDRLNFNAYSQLNTAQQNHVLIEKNILAAKENLRIQTLSFKEDMGTASQVIEAENMLYQLQSERALNAYRYVMALATLLNTQGQISSFKNYLVLNQTLYIQP